MRRRQYPLANPAKREDVIAALVADLRALPDDKPFMVTLGNLEKPLSDGQRRLWWVWMQIMGDEMGDTKEGVYDSLKHDLVPEMAGRGISELSNEEMQYVMNVVQRAAAMMGWHLPSSMDDYYQGLEAMNASRGREQRRAQPPRS